MRERFNQIKGKLSLTIVGNLIYALSQWVIISVIAKFGTASDLGIYSLGLAITAPITLFFSFQLRTILATDSKNEYNFSHYLSGRIIHMLISFAIILSVSFMFNEKNETILVIILVGLAKCIEALSDICMGFFQKNGQLDIIGKSQIYRGILGAITVGLLYYLTQNVVISTLGLLVTMIIRFISYDLKYIKKQTDFSFFPEKSLLELTWMALPLGAVSLINSLNANIPKYFLEYFSGSEAVGVFSALSYILIVGNLIIMPISLLVGPKLALLYHQEDKKKFLKVNLILSFISLLIFIVIISIIIFQGESILIILYNEDYAFFNNSFIIITFALLFSFLTTFYNLSIVAARFIKIQPIVNAVVTIITLSSSYILINKLGIMGAAYSMLISKFSQTVFSFFIMLYSVKRRNNLN